MCFCCLTSCLLLLLLCKSFSVFSCQLYVGPYVFKFSLPSQSRRTFERTLTPPPLPARVVARMVELVARCCVLCAVHGAVCTLHAVLNSCSLAPPSLPRPPAETVPYALLTEDREVKLRHLRSYTSHPCKICETKADGASHPSSCVYIAVVVANSSQIG